MRFLFMCAALGCAIFSSMAQSKDTVATTHYVGVQANQLLRQLLDLGGSNTAASSPYALIYSANNTKTGAGFNAGLGLLVNQFSDGDAVNKRTTEASDVFLRFGYEKKMVLGKRWYASLGIDAVTERQKNKTVNTTEFSPSQKSTVTSDTKSSAWGAGPRGTINFSITNKIAIGTESTWYFKFTKSKQKITNEFSGSPRNTDTLDTKGKRFVFASPAVLFLILKW
jgi:hypothetical protein